MLLRTLILFNLLLAGVHTNGQEHPFLSSFELQEGPGWVSVDWTMTSGSTCDGTQILRSLDSINFVPVGMISGICGDISRATDFRFIDHEPGELQSLYYRIELGIFGSSSIKRIDLQRLSSEAHRFQPSPVRDAGMLLLRLPPEQQVEVAFFDMSGRETHRFKGSGARHHVNVQGWAPGLHVYQVISNNEVLFTGRFVVE